MDAQISYLKQEEICGGYEVACAEGPRLEAFYGATARLLSCDPGEVAFAESATRAWMLLFHSVRLEPGDRIVTSASDYGSNFVGYLEARDRKGAEIVVVPDDSTGQIDLELLRAEVVHPRTRLVSLNHVPTGGGVVQPVQEVGAIAREHGVPFLLDACQSAGQIPLDVGAIGCDMLTGTGRKFLRGPRGTGFLFVRSGFLPQLEPTHVDQEGAQLFSESEATLRQDARCFEHFEYNFAGKAALAVAIDYALDLGLDAISARTQALAARLRLALADVPGVEVTDVGRKLCGIVTFQSRTFDAPALAAELQSRGVAVSCSSGGFVLPWFTRRGLTAVVRASPHYFNTEAEIDRCAAIVADICKA